MWWRLTRAQFTRQQGAANRRAMRRIVRSGEVPGLLAYLRGEPVGWCSVAPRAAFGSLQRSRVLAPVDDEPVWSVVCFFIAKPHRRKGLTVRLLEAAADYAGRHGAGWIEGYPIEPRKKDVPGLYAYTGFVAAFRKAGFREVLRRSPSRPIMRRKTARPRVRAAGGPREAAKGAERRARRTGAR
jgi:GNAT superfamily N-acetyltransferase